jgi:hypothetical protein
MRVVLVLVLLFGIVGCQCWWQVYRWEDCRRVGHTKLYCIMTAGK